MLAPAKIARLGGAAFRAGERLNSDHDRVRVRGAREHNLKNVDLEIPRESLVVFTGVSGSGKSSLAFGTLYAEAQRRYFESVAPYARRLIDQAGVPGCRFDRRTAAGYRPPAATRHADDALIGRAASRRSRTLCGCCIRAPARIRVARRCLRPKRSLPTRRPARAPLPRARPHLRRDREVDGAGRLPHHP